MPDLRMVKMMKLGDQYVTKLHHACDLQKQTFLVKLGEAVFQTFILSSSVGSKT